MKAEKFAVSRKRCWRKIAISPVILGDLLMRRAPAL
jgi:hypothetical protein